MTKPVTHPASPWTPDLIATARARWVAGESAGQIAKALGMSRNAVIGKVNRMGLTRSDQAVKETCRVSKLNAANESRKIASKRTHAGNGARQALKFGVPTSAVQKPPRPMRPEPPYDGEPVSVENVRSCHCRWPIMVADEFVGFCGANRGEPSRIYCGPHRKMAFVASVKRVAA